MATLTNERTDGSGIILPGSGNLPCPAPEAVPGGDGSNCIPTSRVLWYVLRTTSNRTLRAKDDMLAYGFELYVPTHMVIKKVFGVKKWYEEPVIPNFLFVKTSKNAIDKFRSDNFSCAQYIKYYLNKTDERHGLYHDPLTIDDREMQSFMKVCDSKNPHVMAVDPLKLKYNKGELVLVTGGDFIGVMGHVVRVAGQQRVAVILNDTVGVVTAYIPKAFLQILSPEEAQLYKSED